MKLVPDAPEFGSTELLMIDPAQISRPQLCVHDLIAVQAEATPDAIALVAGRKRFTYAQLNSGANQLAHFLRAKGVGPETLAGLCVRRSAEMVVAMLGILKAGGAYVPLDPNLQVRSATATLSGEIGCSAALIAERRSEHPRWPLLTSHHRRRRSSSRPGAGRTSPPGLSPGKTPASTLQWFSNVSTHSVSSRSVMQGTRKKYTSFCTPPGIRHQAPLPAAACRYFGGGPATLPGKSFSRSRRAPQRYEVFPDRRLPPNARLPAQTRHSSRIPPRDAPPFHS